MLQISEQSEGRRSLVVAVYQLRPDRKSRAKETKAMVRALGLKAAQCRFVDALRRPATLIPCNAIVIAGSPFSVFEDAVREQVRALEAVVREAHQRGIPALGICFGGQLIAQAFGGEVRRDKINEEWGTFPIFKLYCAPRDPLFDRMPPEFWAQCSHQDRIFFPPPDAVRLAGSRACPTQAFVLKGSKTYGVQFHPERSKTDMEAVLAATPIRMTPEVQETPDAIRVVSEFIDTIVLSS